MPCGCGRGRGRLGRPTGPGLQPGRRRVRGVPGEGGLCRAQWAALVVPTLILEQPRESVDAKVPDVQPWPRSRFGGLGTAAVGMYLRAKR